MTDILERLQSPQTSLGTLWPEPNLHEEAAEKIIQLREELAAVTERMSKLDFERTAAELERDALREENARMKINWSFIEPVRDQAARLRGDFSAQSAIVKLAEQQAEIDRLRELLDDVFAQWDGDWPEELVARVKAVISGEQATSDP